MKVEKTVCNQCGKETNDHYAEKGWLIIGEAGLQHGITITITKGRTEYGMAKTGYRSMSVSEMPLEFCSYECLKKFIQELGKKK